MVRISPNELSFGSVESIKPIYGHAPPGKPPLARGSFYRAFTAGFSPYNLVTEPDFHRHSELRKMLLPAFSQRGLLEQEVILSSETVDRWIHSTGHRAPPRSDGIDMTRWFDLGSFDILGEMAFRETFRAVETAVNPYLITLIDNARHITLVAKLFNLLVPTRLALNETRFVMPLAQLVRDGKMDKEQMAANMFILTVAGQETTTASLSATLYLLLKHAEKLERLVSEIRDAFRSYGDTEAQSIQRLPYLQAVISESLRMFPPISVGHVLPRVSAGFELHGQYIPPGAEVFTSPWTITHDPQNFADPMNSTLNGG
ncbi:cytochrome P450 [Penicillium hispanicum]|uniref:cytochrome P450 n=1 Tax=Penicillium hispanicum TaxID=1080232 RepID=UPI00253F9CE0|nr:cytochrome P450 [Penicillium hispanicum]KAJ5594388.1 cytochrome P450 [Penicillium hispanicum]